MKHLFKYLGYYCLFLILLVFTCSLFNLIGVNSTITNLIIFLFNLGVYFIFGFKSGKKAVSKGYIEGLKVSGLFLLVLFVINLFSAKNIFSISTLIYYVILILAGTLGSMLGINKKEDTTKQ